MHKTAALLLLRIFHSPLRSESRGIFYPSPLLGKIHTIHARKGRKLPLTRSATKASVLFAFQKIMERLFLKSKKKNVAYFDDILMCVGDLSAVFLQPDASEIEFHMNRVSVSKKTRLSQRHWATSPRAARL